LPSESFFLAVLQEVDAPLGQAEKSRSHFEFFAVEVLAKRPKKLQLTA
jgi:hypothetical protein